MGILESAFGMKDTYLERTEEYCQRLTRQIAADAEKIVYLHIINFTKFRLYFLSKIIGFCAGFLYETW